MNLAAYLISAYFTYLLVNRMHPIPYLRIIKTAKLLPHMKYLAHARCQCMLVIAAATAVIIFNIIALLLVGSRCTWNMHALSHCEPRTHTTVTS